MLRVLKLDRSVYTEVERDPSGTRQAAVVVVAQPSNGTITLGTFAHQGFYTLRSFPVFDSYANTDNHIYPDANADQYVYSNEHAH